MPALPLDEAGKYVAGAYVVFLLLILVYVAIMAGRLSRLERELGELDDAVARRTPPSASSNGHEPAERVSAKEGDR